MHKLKKRSGIDTIYKPNTII